MYGLRAVIADSDPKTVKEIKTMLTRAGHIVVGEANDGMTALKLIRNTLPELVILDIGLYGMSALEVIRKIDGGRLATVVVTADYRHKDIMNELKELWVFGFLFKPLNEQSLLSTLVLACTNFERTHRLAKEAEELRISMENRKVVDKAKGILMQTKGLTEEQAFRRIQKQSMDRGKPMRVVAEAILLAYDIES